MDAELIKALKEDAEWAHANEWETPITLGDHLDAAADALEALQAELKPFQEAAAEYGIDAKTMLTLAKSQIATAQENISLRAERDALLKAVEKPCVQERGD